MFHMTESTFRRETPRRIVSMMNAHASINNPKDKSNSKTGTDEPPVQKITHLGNFLMSKA